MPNKEFAIETKCVQSGYTPSSGEPRVLPIYQSTTYKYDTTDDVGALFDLTSPGYMYTRISNPTLDCVERKIADLEGGSGALLCSSGMAAITIAVLNVTSAGQNIIALNSLYGGTVNLLGVTLRRLGIDTRFVSSSMTDDEIEGLIDGNTRLILGESLSNPGLEVFDFERFSRIAHSHSIPLYVDNTFPTPINCRPFELGADVIIHSTTKYMDGHAVSLGGAVVDGGRFDWTNGKYPELTEPDESYHGVRYVTDFGIDKAFIVKARVQLMRDFGVPLSPMNAFLLNLGLETLHLRVERHCVNAEKVARFLAAHPFVESVRCPALPDDPGYALAKKYMPGGTCGVISFTVRGGRETARKFMDSLKLAAICVHVADARTCVLNPAGTTHRQLTDDQLAAAGIPAGLARLSVGIENADDIIADLSNALDAAAGE
ncbi:MAG: O-acetylhomoserine aminocarboxypropyltransferase/cysteine synthase [Clostridia bacterium]|nr:O-acetylhomoserine aminocarboxypropyltransferase/cysteine synthase [Clostridia bacterium]